MPGIRNADTRSKVEKPSAAHVEQEEPLTSHDLEVGRPRERWSQALATVSVAGCRNVAHRVSIHKWPCR
jgi:hypothetical protein